MRRRQTIRPAGFSFEISISFAFQRAGDRSDKPFNGIEQQLKIIGPAQLAVCGYFVPMRGSVTKKLPRPWVDSMYLYI
jgi:hypothetical protein